MEETRANPKQPAPAAQVKNRAEVMARLQWGIGLAITAAVAILWWAGLMQRFEFPLVDEYMRRFYSAAPLPANDLCIIAIDDPSLQRTQRWPWPRDMQARVIDELRLAGAKVIALDLLLNDPEPGPRLEPLIDVTRKRDEIGMRLPGQWRDPVGPPDPETLAFRTALPVRDIRPDHELERAMLAHGNVVLGAEFPFDVARNDAESLELAGVGTRNLAPFPAVYDAVKRNPAITLDDLRSLLPDETERTTGSGAGIEDLRRKMMGIGALLKKRDALSIPVPTSGIKWLGTKSPELPAAGLFDSASVLGSVTATGIRDSDRILRRMPLWVRHDDRLYPTLGLASAATFLGVPIGDLRIDGRFTVIPTPKGEVRLEMHTADLLLQPDNEGLVYLAWPSGKGWHKQFSASKNVPQATGPKKSGNARPEQDTSSGGVFVCGESLPNLVPGDEVSIGSVYEPALVERRIKQNIEETDRKLLGMDTSGHRQGQGLGLFDEPTSKYIARSNAILTTSMDDPAWLTMVEKHLLELKKNHDTAAAYAQAFQESTKTAPLSEAEQVDYDNCRAFAQFSKRVDEQVRCGIERIRVHRETMHKRIGGKLCLIGWVAVGSIADFVPTSIDASTPGPYLHAAVINSILTEHQKLVSAPAVAWVGLASIFVLGSLGTMLGVRLSVVLSPAALLVCVGLWALMAGYIVFDRWNAVTAFASPIAAAGASWLGVTLHRLLVEQRGRKQTEARFRSYVSPDVVDILVNNPDLQSMAPQKRELTIMFSDVANWTTLTERLGTEGIFQFLSKYLGEMTDIIQKNKATLDKYLGDGIMAFWGAPIEDPDHAKNAAKACVEMLERLDEMNRNKEYGDAGTIEVRFGIATGEVNVGDFGNPPHKSAYTVIGDAVNLSARLESSNKQFGTSILMTKRVVELSGSTLLFRPIGRIVVKGKTEYDELYELIGDRRPKGERTLEWIKATNDAVGAYQAGRLDEAVGLFSTLDTVYGDSKLAKLYLHAIEDLRSSGIPEGWEGTLVLTEK